MWKWLVTFKFPNMKVWKQLLTFNFLNVKLVADFQPCVFSRFPSSLPTPVRAPCCSPRLPFTMSRINLDNCPMNRQTGLIQWQALERETVGENDLNLQEPGEYPADISENREHERDADDAKEKAEDATSHSFCRHVAITNCCDDWEGEEASLGWILLRKHRKNCECCPVSQSIGR